MFTPSVAAWVVAYASLVAAQTQVTVNYGSTLQQIDGFGVSQAFTRAAEFNALAATPKQKGLDYLFSQTTGAGLSMIRNRIGSGGSGDSILPASPGSPGGTPKYVWDRSDSSQVWFSKAAMSYGVKAIYADAWSAPGFMKTNNNENNGGWLCGVRSCSSGDWRQAYANMLVQYVKYYAQEGIPITHLGFLNEPDYVTSYSSMQSTGGEAALFIPTLYNTLRSNGFGNVTMTCCDSIGWPGARTITAALISANVEQYLGVITSHAYNGDPNSPISTKLKVWQTEMCDLNSRWCTTWYSNGGLCEGLTWANKIHVGIVNANLSAYMYWEGLEVNQPQAASYLVASDGTNVTPSGRLWAFAMWSRYVRPGAYRLATSGTVSGTGFGAFKNLDGSVVVIFTNTGASAQNVRISFTGFTPLAASAWVLDNTRTVATYAVTLSGGAVTLSVPARGVVTVKLTAGDISTTTSSTTTTPIVITTTSSTTTSPLTTTKITTTPGNTTPDITTTSSTTTTPIVITTTSSTTTTGGGGGPSQTRWGQCAGSGWTGPTRCSTPYACSTQNPWYAQCN